jgi:glycosyltransferase involved in cell wall biosynthesis
VSEHLAQITSAVPLATILVPSYNYGRYLGECLDSIFEQTVSNFEVIVIDDGSTDDTAGVLTKRADPRLRVITHRANKGLVATLNEGLGAARGRYVARIDADDKYRPYFLEETISILEARPTVGLVYGDAALMDAQSIELEDPWIAVGSRSAHADRDAEGDEYLSLILNHCIPSPTVIARNEVWREVLPIPNWFTYASLSDWFLQIRVARTHKLYYRARTLASYRKHSGNMHVQPANAMDAEKTIIGTLDLIFSEPDRAAEKAPLKPIAYSHGWLNAAHQYFAAGQYADARRCYTRAFRYRPAILAERAGLRHLLNSIIGPQGYERVRRLRSRLSKAGR